MNRLEANPPGGLDRRDLRFWAATAGPLFLAAALLYAAAYLVVPTGSVFSGFIADAHDGWSYRGWSRALGEDLLVDLPTALQPVPGRHFNLVWFVVGRLERFAGVPFVVSWHLLGLLAGALLYLTLLSLTRLLLRDRRLAWSAYLLAGFGTGFGWLIFLVSRNFAGGRLVPTDISSGTGLPLECAWMMPYHAFILLLVLLAYRGMARAALGGGRRASLEAGAAVFVLGFTAPLHMAAILPVAVLAFLMLTVKHRTAFLPRWGHVAVLFLAASPGVLQAGWAASASPETAVWMDLTMGRNPGVLHTLLGYGPLLPLAYLGFRGLSPLKAHSDRYLLTAAWMVAQSVALFSFPLVLADVSLGAGWIVPLAVLATLGLAGVAPPRLGPREGWPDAEAEIVGDGGDGGPPTGPGERGRSPELRRRVFALLLVTLPTTLLLAASQLTVLRTGEPLLPLFWDTKATLLEGERQALEFLPALLGEETAPLVVAAPNTGVVLPALASVRVLVGHINQTPDLQARTDGLKFFYGPGGEARGRADFLRATGATLVWWGPEEAAYGGTIPEDRPLEFPPLERMFDNGTVRVYRVEDGRP